MGQKKETVKYILARITNMSGTIALKGNERDSPIDLKGIEAWEMEMILYIQTGLSG